ncbi:MAG: hypothetical protein IPG45_15385 [Deltaproteobacteria bacterium]|nr:hypothetical protein [Deltaproteobacteria bacterium]
MPYPGLHLDDRALGEVRDQLSGEIRRGYAADGQRVRALPAYLPVPDRSRSGRAVVVDIGGTNVRAALLALDGRGQALIVAGPVSRRLMVRERPPETAAAFFDLQAELVAELGDVAGLPVGYCFSFPSTVEPSRDARLIAWTKGIELPEVVGRLVGHDLGEALARRGLAPGRVTVLNDTVASLIGGALGFSGAPQRVIGLIVGTGTNMAVYADPAEAPKLSGSGWRGPMAINLESGAFHPPHLTELDRTLDRTSVHPGTQLFEKAVAGRYLPELFGLACPGHPAAKSEKGAGALVALRDHGEEGEPKEVARALLARSADLVAAALAGAIALEPGDDRIGILAEGSTFWRDPLYPPRVQGTLQRLLTVPRPIELLRREDANLIGAAAAALTP